MCHTLDELIVQMIAAFGRHFSLEVGGSKFIFAVSGASQRNKADFGRGGLLHIFMCLIDPHELAPIAHNYKALSPPAVC
jgi:hypothetical protein